MSLTTAQQAIFDYIQRAYPGGLRNSAEDSESLVYMYDEVRAKVISYFNEDIKQGLKEVVVQTASETGIAEWEAFLGISSNATLPLAVRRGAILAQLLGSSTTISTIKSVLNEFVSGQAQTYSIKELYLTDESTNHDNTWTYEVHIYAPIQGNFAAADLQAILEGVHPAHCTVVVVLIPPLTDTFAVNESIDYVKLVPFDWADESAGAGADDGEYTDEDPFFQAGFLWSDDNSYSPVVA